MAIFLVAHADGVPLNDRIARHVERLTDADRRILDVLLSHPTEASFLPASEVAAGAGVHVATTTKLAQKLGYSGYPELRRSLQSELLSGASPADRVRRRLQEAGPGDLLSALVTDEVAALEELSRQISQDDLDRASDLLAGARHRFVHARGNSTVLADLLQRRLQRFGLPTTVLPPDGRGLAEHLVGVDDTDAVVAFAFRRVPPHLEALADHCEATGARLLVVTDTLGPELEGRCEVLLSAARGSGRAFQSVTVPMAVTNALVLTLARRHADVADEALARLEKLLATFDR